MKQLWTVYTAEGTGVIATKWTDKGPQNGTVVKVSATVDEAIAEAGRMQTDYDRVRKVADAAYEDRA